MAVLIEGMTLVVPVAKLEGHHPGGTKELLRLVGNRRFCCDDDLAAIRFTDRDLSRTVVRWLARAGLLGRHSGDWKDVAVIFQETASPTVPSDWLQIGRTDDGVVFASLDVGDNRPLEIVVPTAWELEGSLSEKVPHVPLDQYDEKFEFVYSDDTADVYRNRETGKEVRAALIRTGADHSPLEKSGPEGEQNPTGGDQAPRYRQMPDTDPKQEEEKPMLDKDGNEIVSVKMGFADYHELDEGAEEGDYEEEDVYAVRVGPNQYRLEQNPMWTEMATFHDVVEGEVDEYDVFYAKEVVERSGLKTIRTGLPRMFYFSDFGKAFLEKVKEAGGMWDILWWGIFVYNIPEDREDEFSDLFNQACREAEVLGQSERRLPNDLVKRYPTGGSAREEEEN